MIRTVGLVRRFISTGVLILLLICPTVVMAETESGMVGIEGIVPGPAPSSAPVITSPIDESHFEESPITVSGTCASNLLIRLYINDVFSGSAICINSKFSIESDISAGENVMFARAYDDLDQAGPNSSSVTVYLDSKETGRLTLKSSFARRSADPREELSWPLHISGGSAPYAVSIDWGDGRTSLISVLNEGEFSAHHTYLYSGIYKVVVRAVDISENRAVLQLIAVSRGTAFAPDLTGSSKKVETVVAWQPLVLFILFMISTFWLGSRYGRKLAE